MDGTWRILAREESAHTYFSACKISPLRRHLFFSQAPEVIRHETYTETADVFSFGVLLWQLTTRELPYEDKSTFEAAAAVAMESLRPPFPDGTPAAWKQLVEDCWQDDPGGRPDFNDIVQQLTKLEQEKKAEDSTWFEAPLGHAAYRKAKHGKKEEKEGAPSSLKHGEVIAGEAQAKKPGRFRKAFFARKSSYF
jgi:hypothetical protein